jgi:phage terminase large subunit
MEAWKVTNVFERNLKAKTRFIFNSGGTRSGKTIGILQVLHRMMEMNENQGLIISVVSETMPHLKKGAMLDYFDRLLKPAGLYIEANHNKSDYSYTVFGNRIEFFSADSSDKVHGPGRHILFCNELQNFNYDTFFHLCQRTDLRIYADWNPISEFFVYPEYLQNPDYDSDITLIHSTLLDNPLLSEAIVKDVYRRAKKDENYKRVYLEGLLGNLEGLVFTHWKQVPEFPVTNKLFYGLDFGFTNNPTALIKCTYNNGELFTQELIYETGLTNLDISNRLKELKVSREHPIYADSAEPKSIAELRYYGWEVFKATKGADSIRDGINLLKQQDWNVTADSVNLIKELRNYQWLVDKLSGKATNVPKDTFNNCIDGIRYGISRFLKSEQSDDFYT